MACALMTDAEFDEVYTKYSSAIYRTIFRVVNNASIAEDLLQDTFVRFWERADHARPEGYRAFLFAIGHNLAVDYLKKNGRVVNFGNLQDRLDGRDGFREVDSQIWREQVIRKLHERSPHYLKILLLRVDLEMSYDEISAALKIPKRTLMRHVTGLKKVLEDLI